MRNPVDWLFLAFYIVSNIVTLGLFAVVAFVILQKLYKKTRIKFEKKGYEGDVSDVPQGS